MQYMEAVNILANVLQHRVQLTGAEHDQMKLAFQTVVNGTLDSVKKAEDKDGRTDECKEVK